MYKLINIDTSHHCKNRDDNFFGRLIKGVLSSLLNFF